MSALTWAAASIVRTHLTGKDTPEGAVVTGIRAPLGQSLVATVFHNPPTSAAHANCRLELAELDRGDRDADLAIVVEHSTLTGIEPDDAEAWNVHMTLPTLLRILGTATLTEKEPS